MKTKALLAGVLACALALAGGTASHAQERAFTALQLAEIGNEHVSEAAAGKIVQIRSERSLVDLHPEVWHVVYYDPDAALRATEVKFAGDRVLDVYRPFRLLEPITGDHRPLNMELVEIDSHEALQIVLEQPALQRVQVRSVEMKLERAGFGDFRDRPVWVVQTWADRPDRPGLVDVGRVVLLADDGSVVRSDLRIGRAL